MIFKRRLILSDFQQRKKNDKITKIWLPVPRDRFHIRAVAS